jgi:hypothetical protein
MRQMLTELRSIEDAVAAHTGVAKYACVSPVRWSTAIPTISPASFIPVAENK